MLTSGKEAINRFSWWLHGNLKESPGQYASSYSVNFCVEMSHNLSPES